LRRADPHELRLPGRHQLRGDRAGPPPRGLLHERDRRARLRADRERRHDPARPGWGPATDQPPDLPAPEVGAGPARQALWTGPTGEAPPAPPPPPPPLALSRGTRRSPRPMRARAPAAP